MTVRSITLPLALAASLWAGVAAAGDGPRGDRGAAARGGVGVLVDTTRGPQPAAVTAARSEVARLRARGVDAELRVTRSPSETLAAATTLVTRGATTIVALDADAASALTPLEAARPGLRVVRR